MAYSANTQIGLNVLEMELHRPMVTIPYYKSSSVLIANCIAPK